ncbi:MAG: calcium-binding protein [Cyanobacteria bacterium J06643_4]
MTIYGTSGADTIYGTLGDDISIFGLGGNDHIYGFNGNDIIDAGAGNDTVYGGNGNDTILGRSGNDTIYGNNDNDAIWGEAGNDTLYGDDGDDYVFGGAGDDKVVGGNGNDQLDGGLGDDRLLGVKSRNAIEIDELTGGGGKDTFQIGDYHGNYYNNGGNSDYALITDMSYLDQIILDNGSYTTGSSPISGISGVAIYEGSELLAIVQGIGQYQTLSFESTGFTTTAKVKSLLTYNPGIFQSVQTNFNDFNLQHISM